jgi:Collagen triple helix repeat (20 copies)
MQLLDLQNSLLSLQDMVNLTLEPLYSDFLNNSKHFDQIIASQTQLVNSMTSLLSSVAANVIKGDQGLQGVQGLSGANGKDGLNGSNGKDGLNGTNGVTGAQGIQGATGLTGPQGLKGDTGSGAILQSVTFPFASMLSFNSVISYNDNVPQNTSGYLVMTTPLFIPKIATSTLKIDIVCNGTLNAAGYSMIAALFRDSISASIGVGVQVSSANRGSGVVFSVSVPAGSISPTSFSIRAGSSESAVFTFNGSGGVRLFGGKLISTITVSEIAA